MNTILTYLPNTGLNFVSEKGFSDEYPDSECLTSTANTKSRKLPAI